MGEYKRFIDTDASPIGLTAIRAALEERSPEIKLEDTSIGDVPSADLFLGDELLGELEITHPGDGIFENEIEELLDSLAEAEVGDRRRVRRTLQAAKSVVTVRAMSPDRDPEASLDLLKPLWEWLLATRAGLVQTDGQGFSDAMGVVLPLD
jgi:hypothetical protein